MHILISRLHWKACLAVYLQGYQTANANWRSKTGKTCTLRVSLLTVTFDSQGQSKANADLVHGGDAAQGR